MKVEIIDEFEVEMLYDEIEKAETIEDLKDVLLSIVRKLRGY